MLKFAAALLALLLFALPVRAQPNAVEAVLIKQFLVCRGALSEGCESFGLSKFSDALVVFAGAAEGGDKGAQNNLGMLYETGAGVRRSDAEAKRLYSLAADAGDLESRIHLGTATNTQENAAETAVWAATRGVTSIRLVTGGYHMPRSLLEFRGAMPDVELVPHPVFPDHVKLAKWWAYPGTLALTASEYTKFVAAWLRLRLERAITVLTGPSAKAGPS